MIEVQDIGRNWSTNFTARFDFFNGYVWGDVQLKLEPAFAGLTEESLEKQSLNALASLPFAFGGTRA